MERLPKCLRSDGGSSIRTVTREPTARLWVDSKHSPPPLMFKLRVASANGAPVAVDWAAGGHDGGPRESDRVASRVTAWFDRYLKEDRSADTGPAFRVSRTGGIDTTDGEVRLSGASAARYPGQHGVDPLGDVLCGESELP